MSAKTKEKKVSEETAEKNEVTEAFGSELTTANDNLPILGEVIGDFDNDDLSFDKLQIAQSVGPLADDFKKGDIVLGGELKIGGFDEAPLEITVMRLVKTFEENLPYGGEEMPRIAQTKEEVYAMDGTLKWTTDEEGNKIPPTFKPVAEAFVCIEAPENVDDLQWFPYRFRDILEDGTEVTSNYSFASWKIKNTAYYRAVDPINSAAKSYMRSGLMYGSFRLGTEKQVFGVNTVAVPKVSRGIPHKMPFVQWLAEFI